MDFIQERLDYDPNPSRHFSSAEVLALYVSMYPTAADGNMAISSLTKQMKALTVGWPSEPIIKLGRVVGGEHARKWQNASFRGLGAP